MILRDLISPLPRAALTGSADCEVSGVKDDSRMLQPGDVFVAVKGHTVDGHDFAGNDLSWLVERQGFARAVVSDWCKSKNAPSLERMGTRYSVAHFLLKRLLDKPEQLSH